MLRSDHGKSYPEWASIAWKRRKKTGNAHTHHLSIREGVQGKANALQIYIVMMCMFPFDHQHQSMGPRIVPWARINTSRG